MSRERFCPREAWEQLANATLACGIEPETNDLHATVHVQAEDVAARLAKGWRLQQAVSQARKDEQSALNALEMARSAADDAERPCRPPALASPHWKGARLKTR